MHGSLGSEEACYYARCILLLKAGHKPAQIQRTRGYTPSHDRWSSKVTLQEAWTRVWLEELRLSLQSISHSQYWANSELSVNLICHCHRH